MFCPNCGREMMSMGPPDYNWKCPVCGCERVIPPMSMSAPTPEATPTPAWLIVVSIVVAFVVIASLVVLAFDYGTEAATKPAQLTVTGFNYDYDWWTDTIHVWGIVKNVGEGPTSSVHSITLSITVWFDYEPYQHTAYIFDSLEAGETVSFERTYDTPFTLDYDVSCSAELTKVTWYNVG